MAPLTLLTPSGSLKTQPNSTAPVFTDRSRQAVRLTSPYARQGILAMLSR
jgi:hypothetical protein